MSRKSEINWVSRKFKRHIRGERSHKKDIYSNRCNEIIHLRWEEMRRGGQFSMSLKILKIWTCPSVFCLSLLMCVNTWKKEEIGITEVRTSLLIKKPLSAWVTQKNSKAKACGHIEKGKGPVSQFAAGESYIRWRLNCDLCQQRNKNCQKKIILEQKTSRWVANQLCEIKLKWSLQVCE